MSNATSPFAAMRVGGVMGKLKRRAKVKIQARKVLESTLPEDRTSEQIDAVVSLTNRSTYFWNMETQLQRDIARALRIETVEPHGIVLKEGDIPTANAKFYIILTGQVAIYQHTENSRSLLVDSTENDGERPRSRSGSRPSTSSGRASTPSGHKEKRSHKYGDLLVTLGAGSHFGERALLNSEPRSATIMATRTSVELLFLSRKDYERLLSSRDRLILQEVKDSLTQCLKVAETAGYGDADSTAIAKDSRLSNADISKLTYYVEWATCASGDAICQEGAAANRLIFLVEGEAFVQTEVRRPPVGKLEIANISMVGPHSTFGASKFVTSSNSGGGLLDRPVYKMTLRAHTACRFLYLSSQNFYKHQKLVSRIMVKCAAVETMKSLFWCVFLRA